MMISIDQLIHTVRQAASLMIADGFEITQNGGMR